jgi:serine/threonine protein kinase
MRYLSCHAGGTPPFAADPSTVRFHTSHSFSPRTGDRLPHDELISILGRGGIARVYRAHDWRLRRDVAVKVLTPEAAAKPEMRVRFEREARAMAGRDNLWT